VEQLFVLNRHWAGKKHGIRNYDIAAFLRSNHRSASLNIFNISLYTGNTDEIAEPKRLIYQQQNASKEILENILESEADGHGADAEHLDEVGSVEGWRHHGKRDEKTQNNDAGLYEPADEQRHALVSAALQGEATSEGFAGCGQNQEDDEDYGCEYQVRQKRNAGVDD